MAGVAPAALVFLDETSTPTTPSPRPGEVVVLDNLSVHKRATARHPVSPRWQEQARCRSDA